MKANLKKFCKFLLRKGVNIKKRKKYKKLTFWFYRSAVRSWPSQG